MSRSRVTLATMEAAAIEAMMASPLITALQSQPVSMRSRPSTNTSWGLTGSPATARASAQSDARRMLSRSMRHGGANATATWALAQILACSFSRVCGSSFLESSSPRGTRLGSSTTAAATTGPASGPLPASLQPAIGQTPRLIAARSRRKVGRMSCSPSGRRTTLTVAARVDMARADAERLMARWGAPRRTEMVGRQPRSRLVEAALLAGEFEAAANHPGDRPTASHALAPARVVVLAAAGLADELEHVAVAVGKISHQPFAEQVTHFERKPQQHVAGLPHADGGGGIQDALDLGIVERGDHRRHHHRGWHARR